MKNILYKIYRRTLRVFQREIVFTENRYFKKEAIKYNKVIIFGSGPSINNIDCKSFNKDYVITMGNFFEHPEIEEINPKVHIFAASHPPITEKVLIDWWSRCNQVLPKKTTLLVEKRDKKIADKVFIDRKVLIYSYGGKLPVDFTRKILSPWSVTIVALQLAIYCKIKEVKLFGVDHDWQCIKPYIHFFDHQKPSLEYYLKKEGIKISYEEQKQPFPKERLYREYELYQQYELLKKEGNKLGIQIVNSDPFSHFDVFPFEKRTDLILKK